MKKTYGEIVKGIEYCRRMIDMYYDMCNEQWKLGNTDKALDYSERILKWVEVEEKLIVDRNNKLFE